MDEYLHPAKLKSQEEKKRVRGSKKKEKAEKDIRKQHITMNSPC